MTCDQALSNAFNDILRSRVSLQLLHSVNNSVYYYSSHYTVSVRVNAMCRTMDVLLERYRSAWSTKDSSTLFLSRAVTRCVLMQRQKLQRIADELGYRLYRLPSSRRECSLLAQYRNSNAQACVIPYLLLMTQNLIGAALNTLEFIEIPVSVVINMMHYPLRPAQTSPLQLGATPLHSAPCRSAYTRCSTILLSDF